MNAIVSYNVFQALSVDAKVEAIQNWVAADRQFWGDMLDSFATGDDMLKVLPVAYGKLDKDGQDRMAKAIKMAVSRNQPHWLKDGFTISFNRGKVGIKALQNGANKGRIETFDDSQNATVANSPEPQNATVANSPEPELPEIDQRDFQIEALKRQIQDMHAAAAAAEKAHGEAMRALIEERDRLKADVGGYRTLTATLKDANVALTEERDTLKLALAGAKKTGTKKTGTK